MDDVVPLMLVPLLDVCVGHAVHPMLDIALHGLVLAGNVYLPPLALVAVA